MAGGGAGALGCNRTKARLCGDTWQDASTGDCVGGRLLLPYLRAANIRWSGIDDSDIKTMWFSTKDRESLRLQVDDLLVSEGGDIGRSALWKGEIDACYFQNSVNRVRPGSGNLTSLLRYWMSTMKDKGCIDVLCNKSIIAHFTAEKVGAVPRAD